MRIYRMTGWENRKLQMHLKVNSVKSMRRIVGKKIADNETGSGEGFSRLPRMAAIASLITNAAWGYSHLMVISTYHEGETAVDPGVVRAVIRVLQRARRDERIMVRVKSYCAEFLPVPDERLFREDLVQ